MTKYFIRKFLISKNQLYLCSPFFEGKEIMSAELIKLIEDEYREVKSKLPDFSAGDTINVHVKIKEGDKERIQQFQGTVIQRRNPNSNGETFTVRKVTQGIAIERIFQAISPNIDKIDVLRHGRVRRARLFYLRDRMGKSAKVREKRR